MTRQAVQAVRERLSTRAAAWASPAACLASRAAVSALAAARSAAVTLVAQAVLEGAQATAEVLHGAGQARERLDALSLEAVQVVARGASDPGCPSRSACPN